MAISERRVITFDNVTISRSWTIRMDVHGAPETKRDYSDHSIAPQRLEIEYRANGSRSPTLATARLLGIRVGGSNPPPAGGWSTRVSTQWHSAQRAPAWVRALIEEHRPG